MRGRGEKKLAAPPLRKPTAEEAKEAKRLADLAQYTRRPSDNALNWSLWELHNRLVSHAKLYESEELQDQRDAVAASLLAIHDYLKGRGFALAAIAPILRPVAALVERENNAIDLLFAERPRGGRPKATMEEHSRTGVLAALADLWLRTHPDKERKQIAKLGDAARAMKGPWFGKVTAANLKTARDLVMQEGRDHPAVSETISFGQTVAMVEAKFGLEVAFSVLVQMLNDVGPMHRALGIVKTLPVSPTEED